MSPRTLFVTFNVDAPLSPGEVEVLRALEKLPGVVLVAQSDEGAEAAAQAAARLPLDACCATRAGWLNGDVEIKMRRRPEVGG